MYWRTLKILIACILVADLAATAWFFRPEGGGSRALDCFIESLLMKPEK